MLKSLCKRGFTLIELMVVIAIVAILAAVAVPLYRDHLEKTKLISAMNFVNAQLESSVQYYNTHGQFGNIAQIGLPTDVGSDDVTATGFYKLTGGGAFVGSVGVNQVIPYTGCPYMNFTANIAPNDYSGMDFNALAAVKARSMFVQKYVIDVNGTVVQRCYYDYLEITNAGLVNLSGDYLPNCVNQHDYPNAQLDAQNIIDNSC